MVQPPNLYAPKLRIKLSELEDRKSYFFLPFALPLPVEAVEATLLARDVAGEAFPLTVSSCLFYLSLAVGPKTQK